MKNKNIFTIILIILGLLVVSGYFALTGEMVSGKGGVSETDEDSIIKKIELDNDSLEISEDWDGFETVIIDTEKFKKSAANGTVNLRLLGEDFEIEIQEISKLNDGSYYYAGSIIGKPQSEASLYLDDERIYGSIEPGNAAYNIAVINEKYNGKTVNVVFMIDFEKEKERFEQKYSVDPLRFFLSNKDIEEHEISIEIFDFNNKSIFKEACVMNPGDKISSPEIIAELGLHRYEITLDDKVAFEEKARVDYATEVCSSEILYIDIINNPDYPIEIGIAVA